jgi:antitoxin YefM
MVVAASWLLAARADVVIYLGEIIYARHRAGVWAAYHRLAASITAAYNLLYVTNHQRPEAGGPLKTMTYSESRAHYAETLNAVVDDREEVVITRAGHEPVVIVALADYESLKETAYLLRSPENARRLLASIDRLEHGGGVERDILE